MERRAFFKLVAGAAFATAIPEKAAALLKGVPIIYADGVGDDTEGLNALVRGEVVQFARPEVAKKIGWDGNRLRLSGHLRTSGISFPHFNERVEIDGQGETHFEAIGDSDYIVRASVPNNCNTFHNVSASTTTTNLGTEHAPLKVNPNWKDFS